MLIPGDIELCMSLVALKSWLQRAPCISNAALVLHQTYCCCINRVLISVVMSRFGQQVSQHLESWLSKLHRLNEAKQWPPTWSQLVLLKAEQHLQLMLPG